ncbi:CAP domain-containing protein [soil metagenome]
MITRRYLIWTAALLLAALSGSPAHTGELEDRVLDELNLARTSPQIYAERLRAYRGWFSGPVVYVPGVPDGIMTREGITAVDDAIRFLDAQKPVAALKSDNILALAARDWVAVQGRTGQTGHFSRDGRGPGDRVTARGGDKFVGENISYGFDEADLVVVQLIVDDNVPARGHRKSIYNGAYAYAGVACGDHAIYRHMCVIDYSFFPKGIFLPPVHSAEGRAEDSLLRP